MTRLLIPFAVACLLIGCGAGRIAAWLHIGKRVPRAGIAILMPLLVAGAYGWAAMPPYFGTALVALPFAVGFGSGKAAGIIVWACQGFMTWMFSLLFFRWICWLKKYDEEYEKKHKQ